jgi:hypothetical protein
MHHPEKNRDSEAYVILPALLYRGKGVPLHDAREADQ